MNKINNIKHLGFLQDLNKICKKHLVYISGDSSEMIQIYPTMSAWNIAWNIEEDIFWMANDEQVDKIDHIISNIYYDGDIE